MPEHYRFRVTRATLAAKSFYILVVFFLLFFALGQRALSGSEDRWGEIARNMLLYRDWFHPIIDDEIYFDKPLLSYWLIVLVSYCTRGLSELAIRLPGAISALLTLLCSYKIAQEVFDRRVAWLSVCLIITSYGFLFWSHTASAELSNLALIATAVAWSIHRRERSDFSSYLVFYLICAIGCQLKGLTAIVVPILAIAPYVLRHGTWKSHINMAHVIALIISIGVFLLPYFGASLQPLPPGIEAQHNHLSGLELLIRENVVRFFAPFDHVAPFYSYVYELPRILFPWMFLFIAALFHYWPRYRKLGESHRWLLEVIAIVFIFFSLSGSRRWYYILPIMPFCMILSSSYLLEVGELKWRRIVTRSTLLVLSITAVLLLAVPLAAYVYTGSQTIPTDFLIGSALVGISAIALLALWQNRRNARLQGFLTKDTPPGPMHILLLIATIEMSIIFGLVLPGADSYRQLKPFALTLSAQMSDDDRLALYKRPNTDLAYYLNFRKLIPVVHSEAELSGSSNRWTLISEEADIDDLSRDFPSLETATPLLREKQQINKASFGENNLVAYRLEPTSRP